MYTIELIGKNGVKRYNAEDEYEYNYMIHVMDAAANKLDNQQQAAAVATKIYDAGLLIDKGEIMQADALLDSIDGSKYLDSDDLISIACMRRQIREQYAMLVHEVTENDKDK